MPGQRFPGFKNVSPDDSTFWVGSVATKSIMLSPQYVSIYGFMHGIDGHRLNIATFTKSLAELFPFEEECRVGYFLSTCVFLILCIGHGSPQVRLMIICLDVTFYCFLAFRFLSLHPLVV